MVNPAFCFSGRLSNGIKSRKEAINNMKTKIYNFKKIK